MLGFVANTDHKWFLFLKELAQLRQTSGETLEEINFWRPSGQSFGAVPQWSPFFFKLKAPHNAIGGFGLFARFASLPDWLAWESFGQANGAPSYTVMHQMLEAYRSEKGSTQSRVGCILISSPFFFEPRDWVEQPRDWRGPIVVGKSYDLTVGEGLRIYTECMARVSGQSAGTRAAEEVARYGEPVLVKPRLGQGIFRVSVTEAYRGACAVTEEHSLPVLEAAHIRPYAEGGGHDVPNGILLRTDIHRLFDRGYVTVTPDYHFEVSQRLRQEFDNGKTYYAMHGRRILLPEKVTERPDAQLLRWHNEQVFRP
jgi:putative restriction endonuclease